MLAVELRFNEFKLNLTAGGSQMDLISAALLRSFLVIMAPVGGLGLVFTGN